MTYLSIMMAPVKTEARETYLDHARQMWPLFQSHGALSLHEQWGADLPEGKLTSFPLSVKLEPGEGLALGWVVWPDKATHDKAWVALENDPAMASMDLPFDGRRMVFGGFETLLNL